MISEAIFESRKSIRQKFSKVIHGLKGNIVFGDKNMANFNSATFVSSFSVSMGPMTSTIDLVVFFLFSPYQCVYL